jgi:hypothetical protein
MFKILQFTIFIKTLCTSNSNNIINNYKIKQIIKNDNNLLPILYSKKDAISLEHIYPKHLLNVSHYNDYHNIFKASKKLNNARSNYIFSDNLNIKWDKLSDDNYISNKYKLFMPREKDRGIIARSMLYMTYKYNYQIIMDKEILYKWCLKYNPQFDEYLHNLYIKNHFGYDNPLITKFYDNNYILFINNILK